MPVFRFVIVRLCLFLILGILTAYFVGFSVEWVFLGLCGFFVLYLFALLRAHRQLFQDAFFAVCCYVLFFWIGVFVFTIHQPENHQQHYLNKSIDEAPALLHIKINEVLKPTLYDEKYKATVISFNNEPTSGELLVNLPKAEKCFDIKVDDVLLVSTLLQPFYPPKNPHQFDYGAYMKQQGIYRQIRLHDFEVLRLTAGTPTLRGWAATFRSRIQERLKANGFEADEYAIINALLLGQRQYISKETYQDYAAAGAVHILAVSGLHVGILMLILQFVFRPLERIRYGKTIKIVLVVLLMWCFAIIAGLSPSVTRAVTMFSFFAVGMQLHRPTHSFNTLFCSAFVLLLIDPNLLFQVGFQLSYLAVAGILVFYPLFQKLYAPTYLVTKKAWDIFTVSTAAQLGVVPLSLFYFHQFPGLFIVTNLVILPVLGLLLGLGILVIVLAFFDVLFPQITEGYATLIGWLNEFISWVATKEQFVFDNISFSLVQAVALYIFVFSLGVVLQRFSYKKLIVTLTAVLLFQGTLFYHKLSSNSSEAFVFHSSRNSTIGVKYGQSVSFYSTMKPDMVLQQTFVKNYLVNKRISEVAIDTLPYVLKIEKKILMVVDSLGVYPKTIQEPDYVLFSHSPQLHLERMLDTIQPQQLIADGSNYTSYVNRWEATCKKRKRPFHHTTKAGAFQLNYK